MFIGCQEKVRAGSWQSGTCSSMRPFRSHPAGSTLAFVDVDLFVDAVDTRLSPPATTVTVPVSIDSSNGPGGSGVFRLPTVAVGSVHKYVTRQFCISRSLCVSLSGSHLEAPTGCSPPEVSMFDSFDRVSCSSVVAQVSAISSCYLGPPRTLVATASWVQFDRAPGVVAFSAVPAATSSSQYATFGG